VSNSFRQVREHRREDMLRQLTRHVVRTGLLVLVAGSTLFCMGLAVYLTHIRASATALINSAREIRSKADAEREIAAWTKRSGKDFWEESDHPGGDHNYDAQILNLAIARLHVVEPTNVIVGITMRDGKLRCVTVIESTGWYPVASVWVQEWFDESMPNRFHVGGHRRPAEAFVEFPSTLPDDQRSKAFAVNTKCLTRPGGCKTADDILPGVWQLQSAVSPE
jgi:hypothetical protein